MESICSEEMLRLFENHDRVLEALAEHRFVVLMHRGFKVYVYKGVKRDYIVSPCRLCPCEDFTVNFVGKVRGKPCYHVVGFKIAELRGRLVKAEVDLESLAKILEEIVVDGFSYTLRKILR